MCCSTSVPVKSESWAAIWDLSKLKWSAKIISILETTVRQTWRFGGRMVQTLKKINKHWASIRAASFLSCFHKDNSNAWHLKKKKKHPAESSIDTSCISGWKNEKNGCNENWEGKSGGAAACKKVVARIPTRGLSVGAMSVTLRQLWLDGGERGSQSGRHDSRPGVLQHN